MYIYTLCLRFTFLLDSLWWINHQLQHFLDFGHVVSGTYLHQSSGHVSPGHDPPRWLSELCGLWWQRLLVQRIGRISDFVFFMGQRVSGGAESSFFVFDVYQKDQKPWFRWIEAQFYGIIWDMELFSFDPSGSRNKISFLKLAPTIYKCRCRYVYVIICMYVYTYICMHMYIYIYVYIRTYKRIKSYIHGYICMYIYIYTKYIQFDTNVYNTYLGIYIHIEACTYVYKYIYIYICACAYMCLYVPWCAYMCLYLHYIFLYLYLSLYLYLCLCIYLCLYLYLSVYLYVNLSIYIYISIHIYIYIYLYLPLSLYLYLFLSLYLSLHISISIPISRSRSISTLQSIPLHFLPIPCYRTLWGGAPAQGIWSSDRSGRSPELLGRQVRSSPNMMQTMDWFEGRYQTSTFFPFLEGLVWCGFRRSVSFGLLRLGSGFQDIREGSGKLRCGGASGLVPGGSANGWLCCSKTEPAGAFEVCKNHLLRAMRTHTQVASGCKIESRPFPLSRNLLHLEVS